MTPAAGESGVVVRSSLAAAGPLERIDRAFVLVRHGGPGLALRAVLAGGLPSLALLGYFYAERVEGIGVMRLPAAAAMVAAFLVRSWVLAAVARVHVRALSEHAPIASDAGSFLSVGRTAVVVGFGLWLWSWGVLISAGAGPLGIGLFIPLLALRGLVAPSWLARAGCASEAGLAAATLALRDTVHQRIESFVVESLLLLGLFGLALNAYGVFAVAVLLGRSFLGLEMALVDEFLSARNTFVLLGVTLVAAMLLEPLRAAISAQVYVEARVRAEGLDLRAALDDAIAHSRRKPATPTGAATVSAASKVATGLIAISLALSATSADAQARNRPPDVAAVSGADAIQGDLEARQRAQAILADDIFQDVEARRREGLADFFSRLFEWLIEHFAPDEIDAGPSDAALPELPLPGPAFFIVVGVIFAIAVAVFLVLTRQRDRDAAAKGTAGAGPVVPDPRDRSPDDWLAEATTLAAAERWSEALRALYLATLVALDRRAWIRFEPSLTNWQYLRQMPAGSARDDFRALTRTFDVTVYGKEPADAGDYRASRAVAERILEASRPSLPPPPPSGASA